MVQISSSSLQFLLLPCPTFLVVFMIEIFLYSCEEVRASMKFCVCLILVQDWAIS